MDKNIYIAVDMQNDFMNVDGALYVNGAESIKPNVLKLGRVMPEIANEIWVTMDWHDEKDPELSDTPDFVKTFPPHCIKGTRGAVLIPEAREIGKYDDNENEEVDADIIFFKNEFSVFTGSNGKFMRALQHRRMIDKIYLAGVAGDVCVKAVIDGLIEHKGIEFDFNQIIIIEDAIASINPVAFNEYLTNLVLTYDFIKITKTANVLPEGE